jgi:pimeloyl-ACP methyl ester carboxylesterase
MPDRSPYAALIGRVAVRHAELTVRGGVTACWTYGRDDAPRTLVFLHGLRGDHHGLEPIVAHLDGLRVVVPDLPGFGASPPLPRDAHDVAGYAAWAGELLGGGRRRRDAGRALVRVDHRGGDGARHGTSPGWCSSTPSRPRRCAGAARR